MKSAKGIRSILFGMLLCMTVIFCLPTMKAEAASKKPTCASKQTVYVRNEAVGYKWYQGTGPSQYIYIKNLASNAKIKSVKASNKNVVFDDKWQNGKGIPAIRVATGAKAGKKTTVTIKVQQNSKTYTLKCKVTFKKNKDFSKVTIGGKDYTSVTNAYVYPSIPKPSGKATVSIKMASNRKITGIKIYHNAKIKTIKNGDKVSLKSGDTIEITYKYNNRPENYVKSKNESGEFTGVTRIFVE